MASPFDKKNNFLVISDIHLDINTAHTMEINPSEINELNDIDRITFEDFLLTLRNDITNKVITQPQFIIILGDINAHQRPTPDSAYKNESVVFGLLRKRFQDINIRYPYILYIW
jgi:hypothetical protein